MFSFQDVSERVHRDGLGVNKEVGSN
jgi:hypothetical protein